MITVLALYCTLPPVLVFIIMADALFRLRKLGDQQQHSISPNQILLQMSTVALFALSGIVLAIAANYPKSTHVYYLIVTTIVA
jgi:hypothetical protein